MRRSLILAAVLTTAYSVRAEHSAAYVTISSVDETVTEGVVEVHASPAAVYAAVTDYEEWSSLFSDIARAKVKEGGRNDALLEFESRLLGHAHTIRFATDDDRRIRFTLTDGHFGSQLSGEFLLEPLDGGVSTRVRARILLDVSGFFGLFVSEASLREKREGKLRRDLDDLRSHFERAERGTPRAMAP